MHELGLVHRDVKQLNIFVKQSDKHKGNDGFINVQLGDFGSCVDQNKIGQQPSRSGTITYMAPEVL